MKNFFKESFNQTLTIFAQTEKSNEDSLPKIWLRLLYLSIQGVCLVKNLIKKIRRNLNKQVKFIVVYQAKRISHYNRNKDKVQKPSCNDVV